MPIDLDLVRRREAGEVKVGEDPAGNKRIALELHAKAMTNDAVRAIAADHPVDIERFLAPVRAPQEGCHRVFVGDEPRQFDLPLHLHAERIQMCSISRSVSLCGSISAYGCGVSRPSKIDMRQPGRARDDVGARRFEARIDESRAAAHAVDQLERAAPDHDGLRLVGPRGGLVDDPDADAVTRQFRRHGQPDGASANDERLRFHRTAPGLRGRQGAILSRANQTITYRAEARRKRRRDVHGLRGLEAIRKGANGQRNPVRAFSGPSARKRTHNLVGEQFDGKDLPQSALGRSSPFRLWPRWPRRPALPTPAEADRTAGICATTPTRARRGRARAHNICIT